MKRTILTTTALLLLTLPALAADPQSAPMSEPLDSQVAQAAIKSIEADQAFRDAQAELNRRETNKKIEAVRKQCGEPCGGAAVPSASETPKP